MQARLKQQQKSETKTLDDAIGNLVKGLKRDLQERYGRVDYNRLRKDGFSDCLLTRLKSADANPSSRRFISPAGR